MAEQLLLEYYVPFEQSAEIGGDFMIRGIAINETTTANGHKFLGEELKKSAGTLKNVPLLKDHNTSVDSIVGKVKQANFNDSLRHIQFDAVVKDKAMIEKIRDGLINSVSVGARVDPKDIEEVGEGVIIPRNIQFKELSLVAVPADSGATFGVALNNAYERYKSDLKEDERGSKMTNMSEQTNNPTPVEEVKEEEVVSEEKEVEAEAETEEVKTDAVEEKLASIEARIAKLEEADKDEEATAEPEAEEEAEEAEPEAEEEAVEEKEKYGIVEGHKSFTLVKSTY